MRIGFEATLSEPLLNQNILLLNHFGNLEPMRLDCHVLPSHNFGDNGERDINLFAWMNEVTQRRCAEHCESNPQLAAVWSAACMEEIKKWSEMEADDSYI